MLRLTWGKCKFLIAGFYCWYPLCLCGHQQTETLKDLLGPCYFSGVLDLIANVIPQIETFNCIMSKVNLTFCQWASD